MADTPVSFKKIKSKRSHRAREQNSDADPTSEATADTGEDSPSVLATKLKNKLKTRSRPKATLSFGGDEEEGDGEVFKLKKSNLSRKAALSKPSLSSSNVVPSSYEPTLLSQSRQTLSYSAAYLSELKAATPSARPGLVDDRSMPYDADVSLDVDMAQPSSISELVDLTDGGSETIIPTDSSIKAAKQKRDRLKVSGQSGGDYISLSLTKREDYSQGPHPESRLVREDDELGDGADEFAEFTSAQDRIALGKKSRKVEALKRREEMNEMIVDAEEQDEESMEWEQEQLRRGGHHAEVATEKPQKTVYKPAPIPPSTPIPTLAATIARLTQSLTALTTSHAQNTASLTSLGEEQAQLEKREAEMREMISKAEAKRGWFAAFKEWVENVANFLDEKFPQLERLEDEQFSLLQERYDMITQRRRNDDEDDLSLFLGSLPIVYQEEQTDELGRVIPQANPEVARRDRQTARKSRRTHRTIRGSTRQEEGYSTDSSLPLSDATDYDLAIQKLQAKGKDILSDVRAKDFQDPKLGLGKWFNEWRERFGESYTGAWGGLGMVSAWEFWTRLEALGWNPFEDSKTLDGFAWYLALHDYSRPQQAEEDGEEAELGPDGDLVSAMMSTAIVPKLCKIVEKGGFDPYSSKDVRRLVDAAEEIEASVPRNEPKFELILKSVHHTFQAVIIPTESSLVQYLTLNKPKFDPEAIPARRRYLMRRYKLLVNLLRWRKYAGDKFGLGQLATTLVERCMIPVAESGWEVGGEECLRKVVSVLPRELVPASLEVKMKL